MSQHLSIIDAAKYLGKSTKTVRKYIKDGKLEAVMEESPFGHRYVIPLEALEHIGSQPLPSNARPMEVLPEVIPPPMPLETVENLVLGMEARILEALEERLDRRDKMLMEALERMEQRRLETKKKPLFRRFVEWVRG